MTLVLALITTNCFNTEQKILAVGDGNKLYSTRLWIDILANRILGCIGDW